MKGDSYYIAVRVHAEKGQNPVELAEDDVHENCQHENSVGYIATIDLINGVTTIDCPWNQTLTEEMLPIVRTAAAFNAYMDKELGTLDDCRREIKEIGRRINSEVDKLIAQVTKGAVLNPQHGYTKDDLTTLANSIHKVEIKYAVPRPFQADNPKCEYRPHDWEADEYDPMLVRNSTCVDNGGTPTHLVVLLVEDEGPYDD